MRSPVTCFGQYNVDQLSVFPYIIIFLPGYHSLLGMWSPDPNVTREWWVFRSETPPPKLLYQKLHLSKLPGDLYVCSSLRSSSLDPSYCEGKWEKMLVQKWPKSQADWSGQLHRGQLTWSIAWTFLKGEIDFCWFALLRFGDCLLLT